MTPEELELHRKLIDAFNEYIKHNAKWEQKHHDAAARRTRKALRNIIDIAYLRWKEVHNARGDKFLKEDLVIGKEFFRELVRRHSNSKP
jgi:hypothetical protein